MTAVSEILQGFDALPNTLDRYYDDLALQYERICGESLGIHAVEEGTIFVQNGTVERRFAQSLNSFRSSEEHLMAAHGLTVGTRLHLDSYGNFLRGGKNCPEGSPARTVANRETQAVLVQGYRALESDLQFASAIDEVDAVSDMHLLGKEGVYDDVDTESSHEAIKNKKDFQEHLIELIGKIRTAMENGQIDGAQIHTFEALLNVLKDPKNQFVGYKLLKMIQFGKEGGVLLPPRFEELILAANGQVSGVITPVFSPLLHILENPQGEELFLELFGRLPPENGAIPHPLLERIIYSAAMQRLNEARIEFIEMILKIMADPDKLRHAEQLVEILRDPSEQKELDNAATLLDYIMGLRQRKNWGSGENGSSGSMVPSSSGPIGGQSSDPDVSATAYISGFYYSHAGSVATPFGMTSTSIDFLMPLYMFNTSIVMMRPPMPAP